MGAAEILAILALPVLILWVMYARNRRRVKAERASLFDDCLDLFSQYRVTQNDIYYPVLEGEYQGHRIKLETIADDIAFRTLPILWLLITVRGAVPYKGVFDFLVRPRDNVETYTPSVELNTHLKIPGGWPTHAVLRTNDRWNMPPERRIAPHMTLFEDPNAKELSIGPGGIRLVYRIGTADLSRYKLFRQVMFPEIHLGPELLRDRMDRLVSLYEDLTAKEEGDGENA